MDQVLTAMNKKQRSRIWIRRLLVDEVQLEWLKAIECHGRFKMRELIQMLLKRSPFEFVLPVLGYPLKVWSRYTASPLIVVIVVIAGIIRELCEGQLLPGLLDGRGRNGDFILSNVCHACCGDEGGQNSRSREGCRWACWSHGLMYVILERREEQFKVWLSAVEATVSGREEQSGVSMLQSTTVFLGSLSLWYRRSLLPKVRTRCGENSASTPGELHIGTLQSFIPVEHPQWSKPIRSSPGSRKWFGVGPRQCLAYRMTAHVLKSTTFALCSAI